MIDSTVESAASEVILYFVLEHHAAVHRSPNITTRYSCTVSTMWVQKQSWAPTEVIKKLPYLIHLRGIEGKACHRGRFTSRTAYSCTV